MIPRSPAGAVLWECWSLSRRSLAMRMVVSSTIGAILLLWSGGSEVAVVFTIFVLLITAMGAQTWSFSTDNRPGFTLALGYTRPIRTWVLVIVPMIYIAVSTAVVYYIPAALLRVAFDTPLPLYPVAVALAALAVTMRASQWWTAHTPTRIAGRVGLGLFIGLWFILAQSEGAFMSEISTASSAAYLRMALIVVAAIGMTIVGVGRQRRGDDALGWLSSSAPGAATSGLRSAVRRLIGALRRPCPTSSPLRAQLWYETYAIGMPIVLSGLGAAAGIVGLVALLVLMNNPSGQGALAGFGLWAVIGPLIIAGRRVLGLRRKQGSVHLGAFDATLAMASGSLVGMRVGVATAAVLVAWTIVGVVAWGALTAASMGITLFTDVSEMLADMSLAEAVVILVHLGGVLALWAVVNAWLVARRDVVTRSLAGLAAFAITLVYAMSRGWIGEWAVPVSLWGLTGAALLLSFPAMRAALEDRSIGARSAVVLLLGAVGFAALQLTLFPTIGVLNPGYMPAGVALAVLAVVPPIAGAFLAPWSFSRIRHR